MVWPESNNNEVFNIIFEAPDNLENIEDMIDNVKTKSELLLVFENFKNIIDFYIELLEGRKKCTGSNELKLSIFEVVVGSFDNVMVAFWKKFIEKCKYLYSLDGIADVKDKIFDFYRFERVMCALGYISNVIKDKNIVESELTIEGRLPGIINDFEKSYEALKRYLEKKAVNP